jgi:hypothetical protein
MTSRRSTFNENQAVSYAAVGVAQNADVLIFPPTGFTSSQHEFKLGSGQERFETASIALMTWGVIRGSHLNIISIDRDESDGYNGVMFNEFGAFCTGRNGIFISWYHNRSKGVMVTCLTYECLSSDLHNQRRTTHGLRVGHNGLPARCGGATLCCGMARQ